MKQLSIYDYESFWGWLSNTHPWYLDREEKGIRRIKKFGIVITWKILIPFMAEYVAANNLPVLGLEIPPIQSEYYDYLLEKIDAINKLSEVEKILNKIHLQENIMMPHFQ